MSRFLRVAFAAVALSMIAGGLATSAFADAKSPIPKKEGPINKLSQQGYFDCLAWCEKHNKTQHSFDICADNCSTYWSNHTG